MKIAGFLKLSLIDYPKKLSCVIFTQGCAFRCHYCHNPSLVLKEEFTDLIPNEEIFSFLQKRKNKLDAVTISGGEPTIQKNLKEFIKKIKNLNFLVKLDTSGISPNIIQDLISCDLLDYVAMDIKAPPEKYEKIIAKKIDTQKIKKSIDLLLKAPIFVEFRTTVVKELLSKKDILEIAKIIKGAKKYSIQKFVPGNVLNKDFCTKTTYTEKELNNLKKEIEKYVDVCTIR